MQVFQKKHSYLGGIDEAIAVLKLCADDWGDLTVHAQDGQIVRVMSPADHSVTHGNLCIKGRFGWQFVEIQKAPKLTTNP